VAKMGFLGCLIGVKTWNPKGLGLGLESKLSKVTNSNYNLLASGNPIVARSACYEGNLTHVLRKSVIAFFGTQLSLDTLIWP
jgi:hypothetical protein